MKTRNIDETKQRASQREERNKKENWGEGREILKGLRTYLSTLILNNG